MKRTLFSIATLLTLLALISNGGSEATRTPLQPSPSRGPLEPVEWVRLAQPPDRSPAIRKPIENSHSPAPPSNAPTAAPSRASLLVTHRGTPLDGASVHWSWNQDGRTQTSANSTDVKGEASLEFRPAAPTALLIVVRADGYSPRRIVARDRQRTWNKQSVDLETELNVAATLRVTVVDEANGLPLAGQRIEVACVESLDRAPSTLIQTRRIETDDNGRILSSDLHPGSWRLSLLGSSFDAEPTIVELSAGTERHVSLHARRPLAGHR